MYLTRHKTSSSDETEVSFPMLECWNPMTKVATIAAQVDQRRVLCRISMEVLQKKFQASADEPMRAVAENRSVLQAKARLLIESEAFEEDGSIVIRSKDL
jgi:Protein of unknown function (DUF1488)